MFGIGMQEIVLVCVIALVVVGPKRLPELARALGKGYGEFRRAFDEMKRNVETEFDTEEIRRSLLDVPPPPLPTAAPSARPETLLTAEPTPLPPGATLPYPETAEASTTDPGEEIREPQAPAAPTGGGTLG